MIFDNVRLPEVELSGFRAQVAPLRAGQDRVERLCRKYSTETVLYSMEWLKDRSKALMRSFVASIPDGRYRFWTAPDPLTAN
jgi:N-methylhydantoinase B